MQRKLPTKGHWLLKKEFYSILSNPRQQELDVNHEFGTWQNVYLTRLSSFVYGKAPNFWRYIVNLPPIRNKILKRLKKHFPNLR